MRRYLSYSDRQRLERERRQRGDYTPVPQYVDSSDNLGDISITNTGELSFGMGGGLGIDTDGDLTLKIAPGFSIDLGTNDSNSGF